MKTKVDLQMTVNEAVQLCPEAIGVFEAAGIDTCCGGALPIAEAAARHFVSAPALVADINSRISAQAP